MYLGLNFCLYFLYVFANVHQQVYFVTEFFPTFFLFQYRKGGGAAWVYFIDQKIPVNANSFIMRNLSADSTYSLKLAAKNELGMGEFDTYHSEVKTLNVDPSYVPQVVVKGITWNSISLGWDSPPLDKMPNIRDYITYYKITRETSNEEVKT